MKLMDKRVGKIVILSLVSIGLIVGGYIAFKRFKTSKEVTSDAKKNRKVFINNKK